MKEMSLKQRKSIFGKNESIPTVRGRTGLAALFHKELGDHLKSKRFLILLILVGTTSFTSLYGAVSGISQAIEKDSNFVFLKLYSTSGNSIPSFMSVIALLGPIIGLALGFDSINSQAIEKDSNFVFLKLYSTSGNSIPSFMSVIALLGPIIGLALGFDSINSERAGGTLNRLVSQPIYRDSVIIGKFLAGAALIAMITYAVGIAIGALGVLATGLKPEAEEVLRILIFLTFTVVYISFWLALSVFFSVICRHAATSALASIAVWMFFAIFMSLLAAIIAGAVYPVNNEYNAMVNALNNYNLEQRSEQLQSGAGDQPYFSFLPV